MSAKRTIDRRDSIIAAVVFVACLAVYSINGDFSYNPDPLTNVQFALSLLYDGDLGVTPEEMPSDFWWTLYDGSVATELQIPLWDESLQRLRTAGTLRMQRWEYFVFPSVYEGIYINPWGPGTAVAAAPFLAVWHWFVGNLRERPADLWWAGKLIASIFVAGSAALVYLSCVGFVDRRHALIVTIAYAFGTCVWSTSSQHLWQHAPVEFFIALGILCLRLPGRTAVVGCGASLAAATCCRPTGVMFVVAALLYYLWYDRRAVALFVVAGLPFSLGLLAYNNYYLGSPLTFGQNPANHPEILAVSGSGEVWQTPLWYGLGAHLVSPSRGLLVFSPFLIFALWGAVLSWRDPRYRALRFLTVGIALLVGLQSCFFDWWGGFSYGYRHLVDTMPAFALLLLPVIEEIGRRRWLAAVFGALLAWSIGVQVLGVTAYDVVGWNGRVGLQLNPADDSPTTFAFDLKTAGQAARPGVEIDPVFMSIDDAFFRYRLWSVRDSQLVYYATHFSVARRQRTRLFEKSIRDRAEYLAETHQTIASCWLVRQRWEDARSHFERARHLSPKNLVVRVGLAIAQSDLPSQEVVDLLVQDVPSPDFEPQNKIGLLLARRWPTAAVMLYERAARVAPLESFVEQRMQTLIEPMQRFGTEAERNELTESAHRVYSAARWLRFGWLAFDNARHAQAAACFREATRIPGGEGYGWLRLAQVQQAQARWSESVESLSKALAAGLIDPDAVHARALQDLAYAQLGENEAAKKSFEESRLMEADHTRLDREQPPITTRRR